MIGLKGADGNHNSYLLCQTYYTTYNYTKGLQSKVIHMSNNDSIDEETKRILAEVDSDDSKESKPIKKKYETNDDKQWETNNIEDPDTDW